MNHSVLGEALRWGGLAEIFMALMRTVRFIHLSSGLDLHPASKKRLEYENRIS
jgi:hypothetical protein